MSKAFTKEDDRLPDRAARKRSASGLPPGALNYMTADGARRLQEELAEAQGERAAELARILDSATIVEPPVVPPAGVVFGAKVTVRNAAGQTASYRIVGVDEVDFEPGWVGWTSPMGRALLGLEPGQRVVFGDVQDRGVIVVRVDY